MPVHIGNVLMGMGSSASAAPAPQPYMGAGTNQSLAGISQPIGQQMQTSTAAPLAQNATVAGQFGATPFSPYGNAATAGITEGVGKGDKLTAADLAAQNSPEGQATLAAMNQGVQNKYNSENSGLGLMGYLALAMTGGAFAPYILGAMGGSGGGAAGGAAASSGAPVDIGTLMADNAAAVPGAISTDTGLAAGTAAGGATTLPDVLATAGATGGASAGLTGGQIAGLTAGGLGLGAIASGGAPASSIAGSSPAANSGSSSFRNNLNSVRTNLNNANQLSNAIRLISSGSSPAANNGSTYMGANVGLGGGFTPGGSAAPNAGIAAGQGQYGSGQMLQPSQGAPQPAPTPSNDNFHPMPGLVYGSRLPNPAAQQGGATPQSMGLQNIQPSNFDFNGPKAPIPGVNTAPPPQPIQNVPQQQPRQTPAPNPGAATGANPLAAGIGGGGGGTPAGSPDYSALLAGMNRTAPMAPLPTKAANPAPVATPTPTKISAPSAVSAASLRLGGIGKGSKA